MTGSNFEWFENIATAVTPSIFEQGATSKLYSYVKCFIEYEYAIYINLE